MLIALAAGCGRGTSSAKQPAPERPAPYNEPAGTQSSQPASDCAAPRDADVAAACANVAYARQDYPAARKFAALVLDARSADPDMLRLLISIACIDKNPADARAYLRHLSAHDQEQPRHQCAELGVDVR